MEILLSREEISVQKVVRYGGAEPTRQLRNEGANPKLDALMGQAAIKGNPE